jgi:hypothetical protein
MIIKRDNVKIKDTYLAKMHSWKYMQTCGWALPLGYYAQVGALQFQRRAYRLKACALAEGWLKEQNQKALDGLASLEAVG